ncbi:MAG: serine hydrolase domain-containing protein [Bacillota bacterium]
MSLDYIEEGAETLELEPDNVKAACRAIDREIEAGTAPGAVLAVVYRGREWMYTTGYANPEHRVHVHEDTLYDCASLTKVVVTLPLVLSLIDEGILALGTTISSWLPEFGAAGKEEVTVGQLLTHTSGLQADMNLHSHGWSMERMWEAINQVALQREPQTAVVYSDLGYLILGRLVEEVLGMPIDEAARIRIFEPLGMKSTAFSPILDSKSRCAATEYDDEFGGHLCGVVHDEKARALGGACGHAGLFASAGDLARYARMWQEGGLVPDDSSTPSGSAQYRRILSRAAVGMSIQSHTIGIPDANRGLGWVLKGDRMDASGDWMSTRSYGHTGFTGTSLWIDPDHDLAAVLLTNRVYGGRSGSVASLRARVHNALTAAVRT